MTANSGLQSISDLTASTRLTTGDIPPPLVGSSTTVIGTNLYLFAGRLVSSRRMTNELYVLDLCTFVWTRIYDTEKKAPKPRYFHSANQFNNSIVIFGGMGYSRTSDDGLCVLDDVSIFDLDTFSWIHPTISPSDFAPRPRYAHLASVTANKLVVIGGQDMSNYYIEETNVLDLINMIWIYSQSFEKHCGAYRSVAVSSTYRTNLPLFGDNSIDNISISSLDDVPINVPDSSPPLPLRKSNSTQSLPTTPSNVIRKLPSVGAFGRPGSLRRSPSGQSLLRSHSIKRIQSQSSGSSFYHLSFTTEVNDDNPNPIYLYSNYNFTDVKRELQVISPPKSENYIISDYSTNMSGAFLPPGLRFPTGAILGHHLIISGTYLTNSSQTFSIWALNLVNLFWIRIDTGSCFSQGSWNRGVLCDSTNQYIVLGHRDRSLVDDYNHRQTNFDHVTVVDLEAFGIYQSPRTTMSPISQELGLTMMNNPSTADFDIITQDGQRISVNSQFLSVRWPHFKALVESQSEKAPKLNYDDNNDALRNSNDNVDESILMYKNRALEFPESHIVTLAFLQYLYTDHLLTIQQYQPHVLAQLLLLADMYDLDRLRKLTSHALHQFLDTTTAALIYETAALSRQTGLQIRALKVMIAAKKMNQQQQKNKEQASHGIPSNGSMISRRTSITDQDMALSTNWAKISSPTNSQLPPSIASETRSSYYDPYSPAVNLPPQPGLVFATRSRSSSSASMFNNRGYLPTIQD
ncbi:8413_t:CDS:1 [Dentiscutata erythropus]|uniref:8413_t:CDS:1 n=1 Tax=Dentiscutata erythropus TaxID=1348616 RepID=A0A9N9HS50_9GLOM|nr:8413_t:CDS:1 [Dentiscutata erythropus]